MKTPKEVVDLEEIRTAVANYLSSEGCECCEDKNHNQHAEILAKLLKVPKNESNRKYFRTRDEYDFKQFTSHE